MRIAVFSDVHGNALALDAVLADLQGETVDQMVCLGDAIQGGAQPVQTVARLREVGCPVVMGNADHWMLTGEESGAEPAASPWMLAMREWSLGQLSDEDRAFVAAFVPTVEFDLPGGRTLLCFHGSPASFDDVIAPVTPEDEVRGLLGSYLPAFMCGGHTHAQQIRHLARSFYFNPGSVGFPWRHDQPDLSRGKIQSDPWAEYAVLTVDGDRIALDLRRVPIDITALDAIVNASGMPEPEMITGRYRDARRALPI